MLESHPALARLNCETCQTYQVNYDWSKHEGDGSIVTMMNGTLPVLRVVPPPCDKCPKESPQKAPAHELSADNRELVEAYWANKATSGASLSPAMRQDSLLMERLGYVERIIQSVRRDG